MVLLQRFALLFKFPYHIKTLDSKCFQPANWLRAWVNIRLRFNTTQGVRQHAIFESGTKALSLLLLPF